jgi:hypothetical protein
LDSSIRTDRTHRANSATGHALLSCPPDVEFANAGQRYL